MIMKETLERRTDLMPNRRHIIGHESIYFYPWIRDNIPNFDNSYYKVFTNLMLGQRVGWWK